MVRALSRPVMAASLLMIALESAPALSAPTYGHYDQGVFGSLGSVTFPGDVLTIANFHFNSVSHTFDQVGDQLSIRFSAMEDLTVDRAWQRLVSVEEGTQIRIGIMADVGGNPSGVYLSSVAHTLPTVSNVLELSFPEVTLEAGNVYHLVTQVESLPAGQSFSIYGSNTSIPIRPYDRATDPFMNIVTSNNGGPWTQSTADPYFMLGNSSGVVGGPGQPYGGTLFNLTTQGGAGNRAGQRFAITSAEVPEGAVILLESLIFATSSGSDDPPLRVSLRRLDGSVLGSAVILPSQSDGVFRQFALDTPVWLQQGEEYLLTTEFLGPTTSGNIVLLPFHQPQLLGEIAGPATWGGLDFRPVVSTSDAWTSFSPWASFGHTDLAFGLIGQVFIPEPTSAALLATGSLLVLRRRRNVTVMQRGSPCSPGGEEGHGVD